MLYFKIRSCDSNAMPILTCKRCCLSAGHCVSFLLRFNRAAQHLSTSSSGCWKNTQADGWEGNKINKVVFWKKILNISPVWIFLLPLKLSGFSRNGLGQLVDLHH